MAAWFPGTLIRDEWMISLPSNLVDGRYQLFVGLFDLDSGERLPLHDGAGNEIAERTLLLTEIVIGER
ncbi:MAG: hypothetical protein GY761_15760 [Hyphomicrobiales bacterium]|nr:hypothetical protein [Hyphomicrobiales bacterium]